MVLQGNEVTAGLAGAELQQVSTNQHEAFVGGEKTEKVSSQGDVYVQDEQPDDYPTAEERATLRRVPETLPVTAYAVGLIEMAERFSYYGCVAVFTNFIQKPLPEGSNTGAGHGEQSGALGMGQRASTGLTTLNQFWAYVTPLLGAYVADVHLGRFNTICLAIVFAFVGHILLTISAIPSVITNPNGSIGCFSIAIVIMGLGTGGFKSNISPLIAEQAKVNSLKVVTLKSGERVIIDPAVTAARTYNYFYFMVNVGALVGQISMVYAEANVGFWLAYLLPTLVFLICPTVMFLARNRYSRTAPQGSIFATTLKLWRLAFKSRKNGDTFWENVKPSKMVPSAKPSWMTFDDQFVDEVRRGFKACTVFLWFPLYWLTYNQINGNLISQASVMNTHGLPNDLLQNLDPLALLILIPIFDIFIYPALRKAKINFSPLKRICAGFFTGSFAMIAAAVIQYYIYKESPLGNMASEGPEGVATNLNVWIQTPAYVLIAMSEIFASITGLEYAYSKAPVKMRSLVTSVFLFMTAISSAIGEAFVPLSTDPLLVVNYGVMAGLAFVAGCVFWICHRELDAQENELNALSYGREALFIGKKDALQEAKAQA